MPKRRSKTYVLSASGHELWVAFFDDGEMRSARSAEDLPSILDVQPIIGWVYYHIKGEAELPVELTPHGPVLPGVTRITGDDQEQVTSAGLARITRAWNEYREHQQKLESPVRHTFRVRGVSENDGFTLTVFGQVATLLTGARDATVDADFIGKDLPGYPIEMNRTRLRELRSILDDALDVLVDEHVLPQGMSPRG